jgi:hypothetical protein
MVAAKFPSLDLIQIASSCTANWEEMVGDERMRHCSHCDLNVFNLSDMTRDEATVFLAKRTGRTCVRMFKRADGTVITRDCPIGIAAVRARFVRIVLAAVGLFLALSVTALAAFSKSATVRSFLAQGKLNRLYEQNNPRMVMGDICPPALVNPVPQPGTSNAPAGQVLLGEVAPPEAKPQ